ncbi:phospholipase A2 inhibitor NAI-like [Paroedura picta]|uniref:phospholipase A2 inhibitor NAI-like n=1 Tax=Paroedura picta TaxID=143630 RepID=UPI004055D4F1
MMQTFLTVLATFIAAGESLSCESCFGLGQTCKGPLEECAFYEDICGITQIKTSGVFKMEAVVKSCFHSRDCKKSIESIDFGITGQLLTRLTCCTGKECDLVPPWPPINTTPNGKKCPACYAVNSLECEGVVADCTGDHIHCAELRATGTFENWTVPFVLKCCTNHDFCQDVQAVPAPGFFTIDHCLLSSGPPITIPAPPRCFFQTVLVLLLLKVLL